MESTMKDATALVVPANLGQKIREELDRLQCLDDTHRIRRLEGNRVAIPVKTGHESLSLLQDQWPNFHIQKLQLAVAKKVKVKQICPAASLRNEIKTLLSQHDLSQCLLSEVPTKWEKHGDLIIIPKFAFTSAEWNVLGNQLWETVTRCLQCQRVARHSAVAGDGYRSPQVAMLLGDHGIVTQVDNGIKYSYDVTKCMYSVGNITEKIRVASMDCRGETVVDLYAGIGYFTLPYLVHAGAAHVHACEWNPAAAAALRLNLEMNNVADRCTVHEGDNRLFQLSPVADRVNLGLIPSSEDGWPVAVRILKPHGGILHIHGNVTTMDQTSGTNKNCETVSGSNMVADSPHHVQYPELFNSIDGAGEGKCGHVSPSSHRGGGEITPQTWAAKDQRVAARHKAPPACLAWSLYVQEKIKSLLESCKGGRWSVDEIHTEVVKSYAPHVLHVVLDLKCTLTS